MGNRRGARDYFRKRVRAERERHGWSQSQMAKLLSDKGIGAHTTTIAKIEAGDRAVPIDEAAAIADILDVPLDVLLGRTAGAESDLAQRLRAARETTSVVEYQLAGIMQGLDDRFADLYGIDFEGREDFHTEAVRALKTLGEARDALIRLSQFELPMRQAGVRNEAQS